MRLAGKVALVTGASRGIGAAIAERLARDGAAVAVNYLQSEKEAHAVIGRIHAEKGKSVALKADVGTPGGAKKLVEDTVKELGRLDIVVNNAVKLTFGTLDQLTDTSMSDQFATNVEGPLAIMRAALGHLPAGGTVINISSLITMAPFPGHLIYGAAKGALDAMTRAWAIELGLAASRSMASRRVRSRPTRFAPTHHRSFASCSSSARRSAGSASRRTSPMSSRSWPRTRRAGSPVR